MGNRYQKTDVPGERRCRVCCYIVVTVRLIKKNKRGFTPGSSPILRDMLLPLKSEKAHLYAEGHR
uniref:Uncharacterized protein n=1 Tax=Arion vulgaris TaxID=1028688 RepID=A0A0B6Z050_9EUPU